VLASDQAKDIVARARRSAADIVARAEREAAGARLRVEVEARANGAASVAAHAVALAAREAASLQHQRDRIVELARVLAERLLGEQLRIEPGTVVTLAEQVLAEARGVSSVRLVAHPEDVPLLEAALRRLEGANRSVTITASPNRRRGELRLESDMGTLDAELAPQLERLAERLRGALKS
jgi:flagellar biosynthesis/type III secretory pathway protein FliH